MRLRVFRADKGDCLLVTSHDGRHMLVDGGMRGSYTEHVAPTLNQLHQAGGELDLVCISHIDQDHISGVLRMLEDLVDWRVHEFQVSNANPSHKAPKSKRPPEVKRIWHNAFHEQIGKNAGPIEEMLAATSQMLSGSDLPSLRAASSERAGLATSIREAIQVSRRIGSGQLGIPLNPEFDRALMVMLDPNPTLKVGSIKVSLLGPFDEDLRKLRSEWNDWLADNEAALRTIREEAREDERRLETNELDRFIRPLLAQADELGRRSNVTTPNLASLMLLLEERGKKVLLTGDGHWEDILAGLEHQGELDADGKLHVDVLKVQHHGSEHNIHKDFCDAVTADKYVFCSDGSHHNPDLRVLRLIADRRRATDDKRFRFLFSTASSVVDGDNQRKHLEDVEALVADLANDSSGRLTARFGNASSFAFDV